MKKPILLLSVMIAALITPASSSLAVQPTNAPPTSTNVVTSAKGAHVMSKAELEAIPRNLPSGKPAVIRIIPILLPDIDSPNWAAAADQVISDATNGTLTTNFAFNIISPTMYAQCGGVIAWTNLVSSSAAPMWGGMLNPPSPFNQELGGPMSWLLVEGYATSGVDELPLSDITVSFQSLTDGGALNDMIGFTAASYTMRAIAVKADGTIINSGDTSQPGVRVFVLVYPKHFTGGDTQNGLNAVQTWVQTHSPDTNTFTGMISGDATTASMAMVSTSPGFPATPELSIVGNGQGSATLSYTNGTPNQEYQLLSSTAPHGPDWQFNGLMQADQKGSNSMTISASMLGQFFRLKAQ